MGRFKDIGGTPHNIFQEGVVKNLVSTEDYKFQDILDSIDQFNKSSHYAVSSVSWHTLVHLHTSDFETYELKWASDFALEQVKKIGNDDVDSLIAKLLDINHH